MVDIDAVPHQVPGGVRFRHDGEQEVPVRQLLLQPAGNIDALLSRALGKRWAADFDAIVAGDDVRRKKPAPDVYLEILVRLKLEASDCVAIEDSANGLIAASRANIPVLITRSMFFRDDDFADARFVLNDLSGLGRLG